MALTSVSSVPTTALFVLLLVSALSLPVQGNDSVELVRVTAPAAIGVGTLTSRRPAHGGKPEGRFLGSGFAVGSGNRIVTSAHVVDQADEDGEQLVIYTARGSAVEARPATLERLDAKHDLAVLAVGGAPLPVLALAQGDFLPVGTAVAFSGFPAGIATGVYPVTHFGHISAVVPAAEPVRGGEKLTAAQIRALRDGFLVYQMDATVLPGHSGSAVVSGRSGEVVGVVIGALTRRAAFTREMELIGMSFAIPVSYLRDLLAGPSG